MSRPVRDDAFHPHGERHVRWRSLEHGGFEDCHIRAGADGVAATGIVVGRDGAGRSFGARYRIDLGRDWTMRAFAIERSDGTAIAMRAEAPGRWQLDRGQLGGDVTGAIDLDFAATPFTNTLPIRRAPPAIGDSATYRMLYVPIETLAPVADGQIYTRLGARRFRFTAADDSFRATIEVDEDGLVTDYPPLFVRDPEHARLG